MENEEINNANTIGKKDNQEETKKERRKVAAKAKQ